MKYLLLVFLLICNVGFAGEWGCISRTIGICDTERMEVAHGWVVRTFVSVNGVALTFVPDQNHEWRLK